MFSLAKKLSLTVRGVMASAIDNLFTALKGRATYSENIADSKQVVKDIDNYELLDKASILLTPTAYSDARVHSVKTYTGDELVTNGTFDTDVAGWGTDSGAELTWQSDQTCLVETTADSTFAIVQNDVLTIGKTYKVSLRFKPNNNGTFRVRLGGSSVTFSTSSFNLNEWNYVEFVGVADNSRLEIGSSGGSISQFYLDNVSVKDVSSDFDFDRASSATRINSDGLVQDMQSITDPELVLNGDFEELGDDLTSPVNFLNWLQASVDSRTANTFTVGGSGRGVYFMLPENKTSKINVSGLTGSVEIRYRTTTGGAGTVLGSSDTDLYFTTTNATSNIYLRATDEGTVSVTDVSVQQVDPNDRWSLDTGWSVEDGVVKGDGASFDYVTQSISGISGKTIKVTFEIKDWVSGTFRVLPADRADGLDERYSGNGTYEVIYTSNVDLFRFQQQAFDGSIDNISVKDITFSEDVDLARINYDSNGENGHWLLEPTSTNLVGYSLPNDTNWSKGSNTTITENYAVSPDGTQNASRLVMPTGSGTYAYYQFTATSTTDHTLSFYAKNNGGDADVTMAFFAASQTKNITLTNEWQRFEFTTSITSGNAVQVGVDNIASVDILIYGVQCEALPYATSYIPTHGSTVTRATETLTGSGNSTLINSTEGVLYAEIAALADDGNFRMISISDGSNNNRVRINYTATNQQIQARVVVGGVTQAEINKFGFSNITDFTKIAFAYKENEVKLYINGTLIGTDTSASMASANTFDTLNFNGSISNDFYGKVKALAVFDEALEDDELELLTGITNYGSFNELAQANGYTII